MSDEELDISPEMQASTRKEYFELSKHTTLQYIVYAAMIVSVVAFLHIVIAMPLMDVFFTSFMHADVASDGEVLEYRIAEGAPKDEIVTNLFTNWGIVERIAGMENEPNKMRVARYLFNPTLALLPLILFIGLAISSYVVSFLPKNIGLLRQKIQREIMNMLDTISISLYGEHTDAEIMELRTRVVDADIRDLHDLAKEYKISVDEMKNLQGALLWQDSTSPFESFIRTQVALQFYMRSYFSTQYANAILGMVYMGAAVLIIIIGIRGLKFIPSSEPSIILFALSLEFILLIVYAIMLIFSPKEDEREHIAASSESSGIFSMFGGGSQNNASGNAEVESLLKIFMTQPPDSKKK
ncbi:MAG: hypothetical protein ACKOFB_03340 [bacterium]